MTIRVAPLLLAVLALAGCSLFRRPAPPTPAHYFIGNAYEAGRAWYYPREQSRYEATGLATIAAAHRGLTADGETYDATALAAAHQTLQLPAIARVTNLENGRQVLLRLNDRGPASPTRLLALTPHAAGLLGASDGTQIRVQLDEGMTRTLADQLGGGPTVAMASAPRGAVQAESLAPPPGARQSTRGQFAPGATQASAAPAAGPACRIGCRTGWSRARPSQVTCICAPASSAASNTPSG
ncbi:MAG: RlpA-like double-psi beta-barrel domain-containing protein [Acetobacteraceae bacterium]